MLPWGHLAVGYLAYTAATRVRFGRPPTGAPTVALTLGTQLPDLVDKPLNWWFGIFDGRGIAHSLLAVTLFCAVVLVVARRADRARLAGALSVGLYSHLLSDGWRALLTGQFGRVTFLVWPLLPAPTYPKDSPADHVGAWLVQVRTLFQSPGEVLTSSVGVQALLFVVLVVVWAVDGFPGLGTTWRVLVRRPWRAVRTADR